ncbi:hypothetical protein [Mesorhizobium sp. KR2-14]|uniref:hypothetical protein n=1 Tax=Mesorhizobium sp. KR2-14 TaxID=3156610 RepID=UPI0032B3F840
MIQSVLFFVLGFLCAGFVVALFAPAALRRAARLTRKRIEATMPLTPAEIQADKDHVRAEAAMAVRRLEMTVSSLRDRTATQMVDIGRGLEEIKALTAAGDQKSQAIATLEAQTEALRADLAARNEEIRHLTARLAEAESAQAMNAAEVEKLGAMYDEASFASSTRQIELVARESENEKLAETVLQLKAQRKEAEARAQAMALDARTAREEAKAERKRANDMEKKIERLTSKLASSEEKRKAAAHSKAPVLDGDVDQAVAKLSADRDRLEERLTALARENKRLKASKDTATASPATVAGDGDSARLREQMNELAAEMVSLTAMLDGPDSPIVKALDNPAVEFDGPDRPISLADRVKALRKAASAG